MTKDTLAVPPLKDSAAPDTIEKETQPATEKTKAAPKKTIKVLYVVSRRAEGFRRAGFAFGSERTRLVVDDLTAEQVKQLIEEPVLVVTEVTEEI
ncbi:MAG: hypothetical protein KBF68_03695 [Nitrosomonas sp.]|jgi:hypothetical protein|nr:hypothetical protein [Nitrosomonas sp.]